MLIKSTRFGEMEVPQEFIVDFIEGLPGFENERQFAYIPKGSGPFTYLQSATNPDLTFVVADAFRLFSDYGFEIEQSVMDKLGISNDNIPLVANIVTVPDNIQNMTVNLLAPILINIKSKQAIQYILVNSSYSEEKRIFPASLPRNKKIETR